MCLKFRFAWDYSAPYTPRDEMKPVKKSLATLRNEFAHLRHAVFFDHANFGPPTKKARRLIDEFAERYQRLDPQIDEDSFALLRRVKQDFARIIRARGAEISYLPNTSTGINHILLGLNLKRGERILMPEVEFPALAYPVIYLSRRMGLPLDFVPCPGGHFSLEVLSKMLRKKKAALLATSWVQYQNGYRYAAGELAELCHRHSVFVLLDGTQGVGAVPLNVRKAGIDALACGGAKWLFCQTGNGFLYLDSNPVRPVRPVSIGWLGVDWGYAFGDLQRHDRPLYSDGRRFEWGTYPYYNLRLAQGGLEVILAAGVNRTYAQVSKLLDQLAGFLSPSRYTISSPQVARHRSAILTFTGPKIGRLHHYLTDNSFRVSLREGNIRVAPHFYNTTREMQRFIRAIRNFPA